jgi:circadian clock protein KaiC
MEKFVGSGFAEGRHSMKLTAEGMVVFPRMEPLAHGREFAKETIPSGVAEIDTMLSGGIERGTVTLVSGPSGVGKTTFGLQFIKEAATRGERSVVYTFEEERSALVDRAEGVGMPLREIERAGNLGIVPVDPLLYAPGELPRQIQREVEERDARVIMIDGLEGFRLSLRDEDIEERLRALTKFLQRMGVTVLLTSRVEALTGDFRITELGVSYLADNIIVLRYIEFGGELH